MKKFHYSVVATFVFCFFAMLMVFSDDVYGDTGISADCSTYSHAVSYLCDNNLGGASWRVYNVDKIINGETKYLPKYNENVVDQEVDIKGHANTCKSKNYDYLFIYGWDGRKSKNDNTFVFYGPIAWHTWHQREYSSKTGCKAGYYYYDEECYPKIAYNGTGAYGERLTTGGWAFQEKTFFGQNIASAATAGIIYTEYRNKGKIYTDDAGRNWDSFHGTFFCVPKPEPKFYGKSYGRVNDGETIDTGVTRGGTTVNGDTVKIEGSIKNNVATANATLTFSHDILSDLYADEVEGGKSWEIEIVNPSGGGYSKGTNKQSCAVNSGTITNFMDETSDGKGDIYYFPSTRKCSDGGSTHLARNVYDVTFTKSGTYEFCEYAGLEGAKLSGVCLNIEVELPPVYKITNTAKAEIKTKNVYAGEKFSVNYGVDVSTEGVVPNPKDYPEAANVASVKSTIYIKEGGFSYDVYSNGSRGLGVSGFSENNVSYNAPDVKAGSQICIRTEVTPHSRGTMPGTDSDANSKEDCVPIAKKPLFQVWGGNVYTAGNVKTFVSEKRNVVGSYVPTGGYVTVFGSWAEFGVIHRGTVSGFSSGNAIEGTNGSKKENYCDRIPLTISNDKCSGNNVSSGINISSNDKNNIVKYFKDTEDVGVEKKDGKTGLDDEDYTIGEGRTIFYDSAEEDFEISGEIKYDENSTYTDPKEIPKLIIYAKNIKIACGVSRIDAILIADGTISTCNTDADYNNENRSNKITINGAIIANEIDLGRTYGAATGENSGIPAEIINYDSSIYLRAASGLVWSDVISGSGGTSGVKYDNLVKQVYQIELPPRY